MQQQKLKGDSKALSKSSSEDNISLLCSSHEDAGIVTAKPAIVLEDQSDSLCFFNQESSNLGTGLYESIAGSLLNLACNRAGLEQEVEQENLYAVCRRKGEKEKNEEDDNDMLTYTVAKLAEVTTRTDSSKLLMPSTSSCSSESSAFVRSVNSSVRTTSGDEDGWVDIDTDTDYEDQFLRPRTKGANSRAGTIDRTQSFVR